MKDNTPLDFDNSVRLIEVNSQAIQRLLTSIDEDARNRLTNDPKFMNAIFRAIALDYELEEPKTQTEDFNEKSDTFDGYIWNGDGCNKLTNNTSEVIVEAEPPKLVLGFGEFEKLISCGDVISLNGKVIRICNEEIDLFLNVFGKIRPPMDVLKSEEEVGDLDVIEITDIKIRTRSGLIMDFESVKTFAEIYC